MASVTEVFRDLNHNGTMEPYEDASLDVEERVEDLLSRMTLEEKAGSLFEPLLMPAPDGSMTTASEHLAPQESVLVRVAERHFTHFSLVGRLDDPVESALWHNRVQEVAASTRLGIPVTLSSDPRHSFTANPLANWMAAGFSAWPEPAGLAATRDTELVRRFGDTVRREYRALGLRSALHPMADIATEPRWARAGSTFGEDAELAAELLTAYIQALQGGADVTSESVAATVKHFPGAGPQKDGEDPHFEYGKEQIYPGDNFDHHLKPFVAALAAGVGQVMTSYGMPVGLGYEELSFGYSREVVTGLLRERLGFDGVVSTDWGLVSDAVVAGAEFRAPAWGAEQLSRKERLLKILDSGTDRLSGEECPELVVELVREGAVPEARIDQSVRRVLRVKFRLGLFDNPFVDIQAAATVVGAPEFVEAGLAAQRASLTLLKNSTSAAGGELLPLSASTRIYVRGISPKVGARYGEVVDSPDQAEVAIIRLAAPYEQRGSVFLESTMHAGSLAFPRETLDELVPLMQRVPTVLVVGLDRPAILTEINEHAGALLADYGASDAAVLDVLFGRHEPKGQLPWDLPSSMAEVAAQRSDVPFDMPEPLYRFGHGLRYGAAVSDRT